MNVSTKIDRADCEKNLDSIELGWCFDRGPRQIYYPSSSNGDGEFSKPLTRCAISMLVARKGRGGVRKNPQFAI